jgi:hypothetical protein
MKDTAEILAVLLPVLAAFGRLMWMLGGVQARLTAIESSLEDHARMLRTMTKGTPR